MSDKHTARHERKPKPVKLPAAPWGGAQGGKSSVSGAPYPKRRKASQRAGKWGYSA